MVCVVYVYGPQTGRTEAEKEAFREEVEMLACLSDGQTTLCVAGDFNAHIWWRCWGGTGWRSQARSSRRRIATESTTGADGTRQSSTNWWFGNSSSGGWRTAQRWRESRAYVTTQHKPVVFEVRMKKWKEKRIMGQKNIKWWKCKDEMMIECRERVMRKYEELDTEKGTVEGEWRKYNDAFVGVAEELCGRTSGGGSDGEGSGGRSGKHGRW